MEQVHEGRDVKYMRFLSQIRLTSRQCAKDHLHLNNNFLVETTFHSLKAGLHSFCVSKFTLVFFASKL